MKTFPTLYQKTATGAIQQWTISTGRAAFGPKADADLACISTEWGQVGGALQVTIDVVKAGKNTGKKNATTATEQAEAEAQSKWTKAKKKGYVESIKKAQAGEVDTEVIAGGVAPMLAPNKCYGTDANLAKKIVFPAYVQPKLDGMRCIAVVIDGHATLWSRTRKPIKSVPHIVEALEKQLGGQTITLDGELYSEQYNDEFEELISIVRKDAPDPEGKHRLMHYHMYDVVSDGPFSERSRVLQDLIEDGEPLFVVPTFTVTGAAGAVTFQAAMEEKGYEGAMIRNAHGPYESDKRSSHLQKMKSWLTEEFMIIGAEEGRGKDAGTVGAFVCKTEEGREFRCRLKATYARRRELFSDPKQWKKKKMTIRYKRFTSDGVPYLPIGQGIRFDL